MMEGRIETLESRREKITLKFAEKTSKNPRFESWFRRKDYSNVNPELRREQTFEESFARTERLRKSPVFYMRRVLNAR